MQEMRNKYKSFARISKSLGGGGGDLLVWCLLVCLHHMCRHGWTMDGSGWMDMDGWMDGVVGWDGGRDEPLNVP